MLEFFALAVTKTKDTSDNSIVKAWNQKSEELIIKMEISFSSDNNLMNKLEQLKKIYKSNRKKSKANAIILWLSIIGFIVVIYGGLFYLSGNINRENERLTIIRNNVNQLIREKEFDIALDLTNTIFYKGMGNLDTKEQNAKNEWDKIRAELTEKIQNEKSK